MFKVNGLSFKHAIVVGSGHMAVELATMLSKQNEYTTLIDWDKESLENLPGIFQGDTIHGNATERSVLQSADAKHADLFLAMTGSDNANIFIAHMAKAYFQVDRVIVRLKDKRLAGALKDTSIEYVCPEELGMDSFITQIVKEVPDNENSH